MDFENIDRRNLPQEVQNEVYNLGGEMFSIRQLFMDFQNANLANWDTSSTTVPPLAQVVDLDNNGNPIPGTTQVVNISTDPSSNSYFVLYMNEYMKQTQQNGHHILGYTIAVNNPNNVQPLAPTFLPTDFTFSTNLFLPQGNPHEQDLQPGLDTLNFNVMTNHRAFPSNVGPWGGNFVTSEDVFGTMAISRRVFIDEYLLPTLAKITNFSLDIQKIGERSVSFSRNTSNHPFIVTKDGGTFSSSSTITLPSSEGPIGTFPSDLTFSSKTSSVIHISPGTNVINVTGYAEYNYEAKVWAGIKYHALEEIASQKAWVNWHLTITMDSVTGGGMNVVVKKDIPDAGNSNDGNWLGKLENLLNSDFSNYGISLRNTLLSSVNEDRIASDLTTIFNGMNRFVFPGGQTFKIVNPVFNNNLDLITNLKFLFY